jgi:hypothetical protein
LLIVGDDAEAFAMRDFRHELLFERVKGAHDSVARQQVSNTPFLAVESSLAVVV